MTYSGNDTNVFLGITNSVIAWGPRRPRIRIFSRRGITPTAYTFKVKPSTSQVNPTWTLVNTRSDSRVGVHGDCKCVDVHRDVARNVSDVSDDDDYGTPIARRSLSSLTAPNTDPIIGGIDYTLHCSDTATGTSCVHREWRCGCDVDVDDRIVSRRYDDECDDECGNRRGVSGDRDEYADKARSRSTIRPPCTLSRRILATPRRRTRRSSRSSRRHTTVWQLRRVPRMP